jgi:hypothetical protein
MVREIPLTQGHVALVDDSDYEHLAAHKWHALVCRTANVAKVYAARTVSRGDGSNRRDCELMHRVILGTNEETDHRDRDGLNNQRANLRPATGSQNCANRSRPLSTSSRFRGVFWYKCRSCWRAQIKVNQINTTLGCFKDEAAAARAYDEAANAAFGEFACPNFPANGGA